MSINKNLIKILKEYKMNDLTLIEKSIIKKFRKEIWNRFIEAVNNYELIEKNDKIAVCISGGKDSFLMAKLLEELQKHGHTEFSLEYIVMNPGYNQENALKIEENAKHLNLPIKIFNSEIFNVTENCGGNPCYLCARMRRGHLYSYAKELGCNKIALGHHFDDVIETTLMGLLYSGQFNTMLPKLKSQNFEGLELIRPMYCIREKDIISFARYNGLDFIACACALTEKDKNKELESYRKKVKNLISELKKDDPLVDINIFKSVHNVNIDQIIGYKKDGKKYSFLENFKKEN